MSVHSRIILPGAQARNLGVLLDFSPSLLPHVAGNSVNCVFRIHPASHDFRCSVPPLSKSPVLQSLFYSSLDIDLSTCCLAAAPGSSHRTGHSDPALGGSCTPQHHSGTEGHSLLFPFPCFAVFICKKVRAPYPHSSPQKGSKKGNPGLPFAMQQMIQNLYTSFPFTFCW